MSTLSQFIGQVESGNNPNAPLTDYAGNVSVNAQFQQSAGYIAQYGAGAAGIDNQAQQILAQNPNATLGDFYSAYNHGSILPWATYSNRFPLQANNFLTNAQAAGYDQNTPLSSLVGGSTTSNTSGDYVAMNPSDPNYGDITNIPVAGVNAPAASTSSSFTGSPGDLSGITSGGSVGTSGDSGIGSALGVGGGTPINITDLPGLDTSVTKGAGTVQTGVQNAATGIAGTFASIINSLETYTSNAFVVLALVVLGVIFVAYGLRLFGNRELGGMI